MTRFVCIGGKINGNHVSGRRLVSLYDLRSDRCIITESDDDAKLSGIGLSIYPKFYGIVVDAHPERYTILRPVENRPGSKHTANGYGFPHVEVPMTSTIVSMINTFSKGQWKDYTGMSILADNLEDNGYKDPRFPWLLDALRDPYQAEFIDSDIWTGVLMKDAIRRLHEATQVAKETWKEQLNGQS